LIRPGRLIINPEVEPLQDKRGGRALPYLVCQRIDERAPPHPFAKGRRAFDSVLQSRADLFEGVLFVIDATLWNSASGALNELQKLWRNVALGKPAKN
jgi:hypothetical protein